MQKHLLAGEKEFYLEYPDHWDELTRKQAIFVGRLLYKLAKKEIDVDQFRKLVVDMFIKRDNRGNANLESLEKKMDMWANEWKLAETVNFFFKVSDKDGVQSFEIMPTGTKNLVPRIIAGGRIYYGPGDFLTRMTFVQFKDALAAAYKYMETLDDRWLTRLTAICYQRKGRKYDPDKTDKRTRRFTRTDPGIKQITFCYIMGCMHNLSTDADGNGIEIDGQQVRMSLIFKGNTKATNDGIGLLGVLMSLAESGVFGSIKETADTHVWDVLARLYQLELQRIELEKATKK